MVEPLATEFTQLNDPGTKPDVQGRHLLPHFITFSQLVNLASRSYRYTFDEALRHNRFNAVAMRRDPVVFYSLRLRQIATSQISWKLEQPQSVPKHLMDKHARLTKAIEQSIRDIPRFHMMLIALLECVWYGKSAVQVGWHERIIDGHRILCIKHWIPVNGDKIRFKWDGTPGIMVNAAVDERAEPTDLSMVHWLYDERDRSQFIIAKYEPEDADFFDGELAGAVHGVGLRSRLYWLWHLKTTILSYMLDYLQLTGSNGLLIFFYEEGNAKSLEEVRQAVENQIGQHVLLLPRRRDGGQGGPGVMNIPPTGNGIALFETLVSNYFDDLIQSTILGQPFIVTSGKSSIANYNIHQDAFGRIVKYDATTLEDVLNNELIHRVCKFSFPTLPEDMYPRFRFIIDPPNADVMLNYALMLSQMGIPVDANQLYEITGLAKPRDDEQVVMQPSSNLSPSLDLNQLLKELAAQGLLNPQSEA